MSLVFFTDRDLGKRFPQILASAGLSVKRHDDLFPPTCPDEDWLAQVGTAGWIAITHNARIRYVPNERDAIIRHRISLLVVVGKAPLKELAENFVATLPRITEFLGGHEPPLIAKVYRPTPAERRQRSDAPGSVSLWYPRSL